MKKKGWFSVLKNLSWLTQLGFSLATPPILTLLAAGWCVRRFEIGTWIYIPAVILGIGASISSFLQFAKVMQRRVGQAEEREQK